MHYQRWRTTGDVGADRPAQPHFSDPEESFAARTVRNGGCLLWTGAKNNTGYGQIWDGGTRALVHRYAWERVNGPISDGLVIDHLCHTPLCVEVSHLRAVTQAENTAGRNRANTNSTTGVLHVHPHKGGFTVRLQKGGKMVRFGTYSTLAEAKAVAQEKRDEVFGVRHTVSPAARLDALRPNLLTD